MEDQATTEAAVDTGVDTTEPVDSGDAEAVESTTNQSEDTTSESTSEPSEDDELTSWASKKGVDLDSDNAKKLAKMAREAERAMHQKAQRASELEKDLTSKSDEIAEDIAYKTGQDPELLKRVQRVEVKESVRDFFTDNPEAKAHEADMIAVLQDKPHLAGDLDSLWKVVQADSLGAIKSQGRKEALQTLAQKQQAAVPRGDAVSSSVMGNEKITSSNVDSLVAKNDMAWFMKNRDAINQAMAG